jgi:hypothetical protein
MRNILFIISILVFPSVAWADLAQPKPIPLQTETIKKQLFKKAGLFKNLAGRKWAKRIARMAEKRKEGDGRGLAVAGLVLGLVTVGGWLLSPLIGLLITLPLGIVGFILSLIGFRKSRSWQNVRTTRSLAILGLIINGALLLFFAGVLIYLSATQGQH